MATLYSDTVEFILSITWLFGTLTMPLIDTLLQQT